MITLSVILAFMLGVISTVLYLNKRFVNVKTLLEDKILVNSLLQSEIKSLTNKSLKKSAPKNKRRTYRRKPKKQAE